MRQHGDAESGERGVELRDQIGAAEACGNLRRDLRQIVELRREQQLLDIADEAVLRQHVARGDLREAVEIGGSGVKPEAVVEQLAADDAAFLRHGQADGDVGLALGEAEQPRSRDKLQVEIGIPVGEGSEPWRQEGGAEPVGGADPHRAGQPRHRAADLLLVGDDGRFHRFRAVGDPLAGLGQEIAGLAAVNSFAERCFSSRSTRRITVAWSTPSCFAAADTEPPRTMASTKRKSSQSIAP